MTETDKEKNVNIWKLSCEENFFVLVDLEDDKIKI